MFKTANVVLDNTVKNHCKTTQSLTHILSLLYAVGCSHMSI